MRVRGITSILREHSYTALRAKAHAVFQERAAISTESHCDTSSHIFAESSLKHTLFGLAKS